MTDLTSSTPNVDAMAIDYFGTIAKDLVNELTPILAVKEVTKNSELLGLYTEAAVRRLVTRMVHPMRVCTGAVIDFPMPNSLKQLDLIIWAPHPAPAIFEVEGFGLVPRSSCFGVIEIKRSNYSDADRDIRDVLALADSNTIVRDTPAPGPPNMRASAFGIVCVLEKKPSSILQGLIDQKRAAAIFDRNSKGGVKVRTKDVLELVNFLYLTTWQFRFFSTMGPPIQINTTGL